MNPNRDSLQQLTQLVATYRDQRNWKQFHPPKNLAANLVVEAGELLEHYRWQEEPDDFEAIKDEAADILYAILMFAHDTGIDLGDVLIKKLVKNAANYPMEKAKNSAKKYTYHQEGN